MSRFRNRSDKMVAVAVVAAVLVVLHLVGVVPVVSGVVSSALMKVAAPAYGAGVALDDALTGEAADNCACAADVVTELDRIMAENAKLRSVVLENEELKAALSFRERGDDRAVLSRVVSESSDETFRGLVIDRGRDDGIAKGHPVIAGDGIMIGKISSVGRERATVSLLTDSQSRLAVSIQNGTGTLGVLEGDRGLSMSIFLIPQHENLAVGDAVITSGIEPGVRRGLAVGIIDKINIDTQDPFQSATVTPFAFSEHPVFVQVVIAEDGL
ncbi:MAG: rod shape-determining protein MreC [Patescibacteria group bacterium]|nr:rod shape-determining protein MreC [Patescibacteria group bacterium]